MTGEAGPPFVQLLLYRFGPDAEFRGQLVGALERMESGGTLRILDVLFLSTDAATGEVAAIDVRGDGAGGIVAPLLGFRLDAGERSRATARALADRPGHVPADTIRALAAALAPGGAIAAVLVEHVWARALEDAVARTGGTRLASEPVDAARLAELSAELLRAAQD